MILTGKNQSTWKKKPVPVPFCPTKIPRGLALNPTQASAVTGWHMTTLAMAQPFLIKLKKRCF
jgi:hypothetical protein